jgi:hypothetical protein
LQFIRYQKLFPFGICVAAAASSDEELRVKNSNLVVQPAMNFDVRQTRYKELETEKPQGVAHSGRYLLSSANVISTHNTGCDIHNNQNNIRASR